MGPPTGTLPARKTRALRLGFLGVGWIGRARLSSLLDSGVAGAAAIADPDGEALERACALASGARRCASLDELLDSDLDGIVIATPSACHAEQARAALAAGVAVFCQKPLARTAAEARSVVDAARAADRLLCVDLSYRTLRGMDRLRAAVRSGELGEIHAADLSFHNAYGPDKPWFYDRAASGGGCAIDLGVHLVDLLLWVRGGRVERVQADLFDQGRRLTPADLERAVEDLVLARLELDGGSCVARLACSWRMHAGCEAAIEATFLGSRGGARLRNVGGSFHDFVVERLHGTGRVEWSAPPDAWGGRALVAWAERLARGESGFDAECERQVEVAAVLDRIYGRSGCAC